jgi:hypothetical protein
MACDGPAPGLVVARDGAALTISRPQNCGAVSRRACNQIERKTIPNYCKLAKPPSQPRQFALIKPLRVEC